MVRKKQNKQKKKKKKKQTNKRYYQQSFWIYKPSRHKIRVPIELPAEVFSSELYIWKLVQNDDDKP